MLQEKARAKVTGEATRNMNVYLMKFMGVDGTLPAYKCARLAKDYMDLVKAAASDFWANSRAPNAALPPAVSKHKNCGESPTSSSADRGLAKPESPSCPTPPSQSQATPKSGATSSARRSDMYDSIPLAIDRLREVV